jgi:hypothetical protein
MQNPNQKRKLQKITQKIDSQIFFYPLNIILYKPMTTPIKSVDCPNIPISVDEKIKQIHKIINDATKNNKTYNISHIMQQTNHLTNPTNEAYYEDVLSFLNLLFQTTAKSISGIRIQRLNFSRETMLMYNLIIKRHKLEDVGEFDIDNYNFNIEEQDRNVVMEIVKMTVNALLQDLKFELRFKKKDGKLTPFIKNMDK